MIVTADDIAKVGDISDHEYSSDESDEKKQVEIVRQRKGRSDNCDDEEGADVDEEETHQQEDTE